MTHFCDLVLPCINKLQPYVPGKAIAELERELGIKNIVKLASNENPLGPSKNVLTAIAQAAKEINLYPDGNGYSLKKALADKYQLSSEQFTLGNGSNDVLELIARAFVSPADEVLFSQYSFAVYPLVTQAIGATAVIAKANNYGHDLQAMSRLITEKTKVIFIANPNNPTGSHLAADELEQFIANVPATTIVVLDEAYVEYSQQTVESTDWLAKYTNLIITRTFSKAYGLAGLRIGYAMSNTEVADLVNRIRQPFNANSIALAAASEAIADDDYIAATRVNNDKGMAQLIAGFSDLNLAFIRSKANFISVDVQKNGEQVFADLLKCGVIVRPLSNYGLVNHIRVSIGLPAENAQFLAALRTVL